MKITLVMSAREIMWANLLSLKNELTKNKFSAKRVWEKILLIFLLLTLFEKWSGSHALFVQLEGRNGQLRLNSKLLAMP